MVEVGLVDSWNEGRMGLMVDWYLKIDECFETTRMVLVLTLDKMVDLIVSQYDLEHAENELEFDWMMGCVEAVVYLTMQVCCLQLCDLLLEDVYVDVEWLKWNVVVVHMTCSLVEMLLIEVEDPVGQMFGDLEFVVVKMRCDERWKMTQPVVVVMSLLVELMTDAEVGIVLVMVVGCC